MKKQLLLPILIPFFLQAQNWNVFNKNYRYNYKFNNSALISNVLFADSSEILQGDTIYYLNRIAVECGQQCYGLSVGSTSSQTLVVPNMPQFLQRMIRKSSSGTVGFIDTVTMHFFPKCTLNQSWLYDTTNNVTAVCSAIGIQNIFGNPDSVKTILLNNTDTIKLSKSYGLIVFPRPYAHSEYYRMVGIENRNSYDQQALFGLKVPNAWDFYDFNIGDMFCHKFQKTDYWQDPNNPKFYTNCSQLTILSKSLTATGYNYSVSAYYSINTYTAFYMMNLCSSNFYTVGILSFYNLTSDSLIENLMYPGMLMGEVQPSQINAPSTTWSSWDGKPHLYHYDKHIFYLSNIVEFGEANGHQYKFTGNVSCGLNPVLKSKYDGLSWPFSPPPYDHYRVYGAAACAFGTKIGYMGSAAGAFEYNHSTCMQCGPGFGYAIVATEEQRAQRGFTVSPNPVNEFLLLEGVSYGPVILYDLVGKEVLRVNSSETSQIDCRSLPEGTYLLKYEAEHKKIVIRH